MIACFPEDKNIPLIIDLDGTLVRGDYLHESLVFILFHHPLQLIDVIKSIKSGRAALKKKTTDVMTSESSALVYREQILMLASQAKESGRKVYLVTAADHSIAESVQNHLGCFDGVKGSDSGINLKGHDKLSWLHHQFPQGFIYAGDSSADLPIWLESKLAILVGSGAKYAEKLRNADVVVEVIDDKKINSLHDWISELRVHQWTKNLLIFIPLFLGHIANDFQAVIRTGEAFILFSLIASGTYILNDLVDLVADRGHPTKRFRPIAAGRIPISSALVASLFLISMGSVGCVILGFQFSFFVGIYLCLTLTYSFYLKKLPIVDVGVIGCLFTLRVLMGSAANGLPISIWLTSFSICFFYSLSMAKRHVEVMRTGTKNLEIVRGRGYLANDWPITLTSGLGTAICSIIIMMLFVAESAPQNYHTPSWLYVAPACVFLWVQRIWLLSHRMELDDDPVNFALRDKISYFLGAIIICSFMLAL